MRLTKKQIEFIKNTILKFLPDSKIYLFGSILNDKIKGGDVDIFIISKEKIDFLTKSQIKFILENYLFRKVDLVFHKDFNSDIEKEAMKGIKI